MALIDEGTEFGRRVARRLREERVIWLVTVRADLTPQPTPVWFYWDGATFLIYSQPGRQKLRNIERHPRVALHFDSNGRGGDIVVFTGEARLDREASPPHPVAEYAAKYQAGFERFGVTAEEFGQDYSVPIRVTPAGLRGH